MSPLSLACQHLPGGSVIRVSGEVDASTSVQFATLLLEAHPRPHEPLVLDLSAMTFMDSSGLTVLLNTRASAEAAGGRLLLAAPHQRVRRVLEVTGLVRLFSPYEDLDEAIAAAGLRAEYELLEG
ncbi:STAS domain-containing protein [Nonomuraea sp. NPDC050556]|uniref:STAS domain-containing protein n=1 Tax=Nonomuraea sp. NPDC050556 TaxID=3364369 RepID=UPI0037A28B60